MYKVAVIGDRESILGFKAVGLDVIEAESAEDASKALTAASKQGYAIIFIIETLAIQLEKEIDEYKNCMTPAIVPIPGKDGPQGFSMSNIKKSVERAVGADILFKD